MLGTAIIRHTLPVLFGMIGLLQQTALAETVIKCTDHSGHVAFQATHCSAGQTESAIEIARAPTPAASPDYALPPAPRVDRPARARSATAKAGEQSFECRTAGGALFYRHGGCPAAIRRENPKTHLHASRGERVTARRIPRAEACRAMRSVARKGREYDDVTPTYDKNLGRDPCRNY